LTTLRLCALLAAFAWIALAVVYLRAEQTRAAARALLIESQQVEARRELWRLQTGVARLKAPERIRDRAEWFDADLIPPNSDPANGQAGRVVYSHP
jgi:hypothetical protein